MNVLRNQSGLWLPPSVGNIARDWISLVPRIRRDFGGTKKRIRGASGGRSRKQDCCCFACTCEGITSCIEGRDVEVTLTGVIDDDCTDCEAFNGTYLFTNMPAAVGTIACVSARSITNNTCGAGSLIFEVRIDGPADQRVWLRVNHFPGSIHNLASLGCEAIERLCNGEIVDLEFLDSVGSRCDGSGSSGTAQLL